MIKQVFFYLIVEREERIWNIRGKRKHIVNKIPSENVSKPVIFVQARVKYCITFEGRLYIVVYSGVING